MESDDSEIDLLKYVDILRRWLWLIVAGALLAGGAALVISFLLPPVFEAEADVTSVKSFSQISLSPDYRTLSEAQLTQGLDLIARQKALVAIAKGSDVISAVIAQLGTTLSEDERQVSKLVEIVNVSTDGDLIRIKVQNKDPQKAAMIANTWARTYANRVNQLYTETPTGLDQIQAQSSQAWQAYQTAQTTFDQFVGSNQIDTISRQIAAKQNTLNDLYSAQRNLDRLLQDAMALQNLISKDSSVNPSDAANRLAMLLIRANAATLSYTAQPLQLQVTSGSLTEATGSNVHSQIDSLIASLQAQQKQIQTQLSDSTLQQQILVLQRQLEEQNAKKQELSSARDLAWSTYKTISSKVEEVKIAQQSSGTIVRVAGTAIVPTNPIAPKKSTNTLIAAIVGLLLSIGIAFGVEFMDSSIRSPKDAAELLHLPVIRVQSAMASAGDYAHQGNVSPSPMILQAYHRLQARVLSDSKFGGALLIVDSGQNGAVSRFVSELGAVAAQLGRSVLLVDANASDPSLDRIFELPNDRGWDTLLRDGIGDASRYMQATSIRNLNVVTSGPAPKTFDHTVMSSQLESAIQTLKSKADLVVFRGPAGLSFPDHVMMAKHSDAVLLFAVAGVTDRTAIVHLKEELETVNQNIVGLVLVQFPPRNLFWNLTHRIANAK